MSALQDLVDERPGILLVLGWIRDRSRFAAYVQALPPIYAAFNGSYLALAPEAQVQRFGSQSASFPPASVVVSVWPSLDGVKQFWHSHVYQDVAKLRAGCGEFYVAALSACVSAKELNTARPPNSALMLELDSREALAPSRQTSIAHGDLSSLEGQFPSSAAHLFWQPVSEQSGDQSALAFAFPALPI